MTNPLQSVLNRPTVRRVRRNHALEHATIHLLSQRHPKSSFIGRSDSRGFYIYGAVSIEELASAANDALNRLRAGDSDLAIHPNCGTNLVTAGILAGTASFLSLLGGRSDTTRSRFERFPFAIMAAMLALLFAQPVGKAAQRHITTDGIPGNMEIVRIQKVSAFRGPVHQVLTAN